MSCEKKLDDFEGYIQESVTGECWVCGVLGSTTEIKQASPRETTKENRGGIKWLLLPRATPTHQGTTDRGKKPVVLSKNPKSRHRNRHPICRFCLLLGCFSIRIIPQKRYCRNCLTEWWLKISQATVSTVNGDRNWVLTVWSLGSLTVGAEPKDEGIGTWRLILPGLGFPDC